MIRTNPKNVCRSAVLRLLFGLIILSMIACLPAVAADYSFYNPSTDGPYPLVEDAPVELLSKNASMDGQDLEIQWATTGHTASPAPVYAYGPHAIRFTGVHDNTYLPKTVAELLGVSSFLDCE